ncbi:MAG: TRAP transporter small permease [Minwuia sp.]|uniref:TRAP transporter small permease n=1 Tax=Minwuia sp. TaxID=2493630 RepID=UPI003A8C5D1F
MKTAAFLCRAVALFGGALLLVVMMLVVVSVIGRAFSGMGLGPVPGDFELVEMFTAVAIFCFLPWCQLERGHVAVDILAGPLGPRRDAALAVLFNLGMTAVAAFILWRLWAGMQDKITYSETTFILQLPVWWGYAACLPFAGLFIVISALTVWRSLKEALG